MPGRATGGAGRTGRVPRRACSTPRSLATPDSWPLWCRRAAAAVRERDGPACSRRVVVRAAHPARSAGAPRLDAAGPSARRPRARGAARCRRRRTPIRELGAGRRGRRRRAGRARGGRRARLPGRRVPAVARGGRLAGGESRVGRDPPRMVGVCRRATARCPSTATDLETYLRLPAGHRSSVFAPASRRIAPVRAWAVRLWPWEGEDLLHGLIRVEVAPSSGTPERPTGSRAGCWPSGRRSARPIRAWDRMLYGIRSVEEFLRARLITVTGAREGPGLTLLRAPGPRSLTLLLRFHATPLPHRPCCRHRAQAQHAAPVLLLDARRSRRRASAPSCGSTHPGAHRVRRGHRRHGLRRSRLAAARRHRRRRRPGARRRDEPTRRTEVRALHAPRCCGRCPRSRCSRCRSARCTSRAMPTWSSRSGWTPTPGPSSPTGIPVGVYAAGRPRVAGAARRRLPARPGGGAPQHHRRVRPRHQDQRGRVPAVEHLPDLPGAPRHAWPRSAST